MAADGISRATAAAVTAAERDTAIAEIKAFRQRTGGAPVDLGLPSVKPLFLGIERSREGRVLMHLQDSVGSACTFSSPMVSGSAACGCR